MFFCSSDSLKTQVNKRTVSRNGLLLKHTAGSFRRLSEGKLAFLKSSDSFNYIFSRSNKRLPLPTVLV